METIHKLVLLRHGQSLWNLEKRFTGWTDVDLTMQGEKEARSAGRLLREEGYTFDVAYTSVLKRAIRTLWLVLEEMDLEWIPVHKAWQLNERHYGALQGLSKPEMVSKHGVAQVELWRRSFDVLPPPLDQDDPRHPHFDRRYWHFPPEELPRHESLKIVMDRLIPYWHGTIAPVVKSGKRVLITAHGNSLRGLIKHLGSSSDQDIVELNIPTGIPIVYELDADLKPLTSYYLGDLEEIQKAVESVARQVNA